MKEIKERSQNVRFKRNVRKKKTYRHTGSEKLEQPLASETASLKQVFKSLRKKKQK